jgi:integrase
VNLYARQLATVLKFAYADGGLAFNPSAVTVTERRVEVPAITAADLKKLYEAAPEEFAPAILFGAFAGLRASEACAVTVADIDFLAGTLTVDKAADKWGEFVKTKTPRSMRTVPLASEVLTLVARACEGKPRGDTVATNADGGVVTTGSFTKAFSRTAATAGVDVTFHALRKYYATTLLANGVNPKAAAKFLGDSVETMLKTYALVQHTDAELARAAISSAFAATVAA